MNSKHLEAKLLQQSQRRHFNKFLGEEDCSSLKESIVQAIYFPSSSEILGKIFSILKLEASKKRTFLEASKNLVDDEALLAIRALQATQALLCFFPNYSPREKSIVTELPVLEIKSQSAENSYRLNSSNKN